jgi:hypothetical protein
MTKVFDARFEHHCHEEFSFQRLQEFDSDRSVLYRKFGQGLMINDRRILASGIPMTILVSFFQRSHLNCHYVGLKLDIDLHLSRKSMCYQWVLAY